MAHLFNINFQNGLFNKFIWLKQNFFVGIGAFFSADWKLSEKKSQKELFAFKINDKKIDHRKALGRKKIAFIRFFLGMLFSI